MFANGAHQFHFERAHALLLELFGKVGRHPSEASLLVTVGDGSVHVDLETWGPLDAVVRVVALVGNVRHIEAQEHWRALLEHNGRSRLATFGVDDHGNLTVSSGFLASSASREQLLAAVTAVARVADGYRAGLAKATAPTRPETITATEPVDEADAIDRVVLDDLEIYYCVRGLPISVSQIVELSEFGATDADILQRLPQLDAEDLRQVRRFAELHPERVHLGMEQPEPEPAPEEPPAPVAPTPRPSRPRIWLDDLGLYHSIRGLPISVSEVFLRLEAGETDADVLAHYPDLQPEDLEATRRFAAEHPELIDRPAVPAAPLAADLATPLPAPADRGAPAPKPAPRKKRIWLDDLGLYYCIRGLPIDAAAVRARLDAGESDADILAAYPDLEPEDLDAVREFLVG